MHPPNRLLVLLVAATLGLVYFGTTQAEDKIDMMVRAFEGDPSRYEIKSLMDRVIPQYGLQISQENYSRAGSVLVVMRKEYGVNEMEILRCMREIDQEIKFPDGAALCAHTLAN